VRAYDVFGRVYFETAMPSLPDSLHQTFAEGFARVETNEGAWRIYTHRTDEGIVQVGQPVAVRDALARDLALRVLTPMLPLIPALALLIGWVLRRGLAPLDEASRSVGARDASRLDALPTHDVPAELVPLVSQINSLLARLAGSLDAQRRFLADAAHELRSPVAALALQAQLLKRAPTPQARAAAMAELEHGVERARRLVQQLLGYARLEADVQAQPHRPVDLAALARQAVGSFAPRADERSVDLGADAAGPIVVPGNDAELRSLLENLIDNALRYAPAGSAVTVAVRAGDSVARLSVVDSGPGIPASDRERVFERFHRVAGDETFGTGLGLAIAKSIVERHRGSIGLSDTHPGSDRPGLAVEIRLPLAEAVLHDPSGAGRPIDSRHVEAATTLSLR
jgi:signal transduction histidine kinase